MPDSLTMTVSDFKAKCLDVFDRLANHSLERVTITKRGRVVAVVNPPLPDKVTVASLYGCMKGSVVIPPGLDLTEPVFDPDDISAEDGILHY